VEIMIGVDPYYDMKSQARWGMGKSEVIVYAYDPDMWSHLQFSTALRDANQEFLLSRDLLALEDHPHDIEMVNGVCMNQGTYALALVQSLSKLNTAAKQMASKGFYHTWPEEYLTPLFAHRQDPR
jgi:hypothetical protein